MSNFESMDFGKKAKSVEQDAFAGDRDPKSVAKYLEK